MSNLSHAHRISLALAASLVGAATLAAPAVADPPFGIAGHHQVTRIDTNPGTSVRDAPMGPTSAGHGTPVAASV